MNTRTSYPHFFVLTIFAALVCLAVFARSAVAVPITIEDGSSDTLLVGESGTTDGSSNTIFVGGNLIGNPGGSGEGPGAITDGTSNTITVSENVIGGSGGSNANGSITDGTSNTITVGENVIGNPGSSSGSGSITDGTSNTIGVGESSAHGVPDGGATFALLAGACSALLLVRRWQVR